LPSLCTPGGSNLFVLLPINSNSTQRTPSAELCGK
jgi:hypothetical protein